MRVALMSMVGAEEERGLAVKESGQGPEINLKASQRRVGRSLMRFSWPDGLEATPSGDRILGPRICRARRREKRRARSDKAPGEGACHISPAPLRHGEPDLPAGGQLMCRSSTVRPST
jgi:hypothetical protein